MARKKAVENKVLINKARPNVVTRQEEWQDYQSIILEKILIALLEMKELLQEQTKEE